MRKFAIAALCALLACNPALSHERDAGTRHSKSTPAPASDYAEALRQAAVVALKRNKKNRSAVTRDDATLIVFGEAVHYKIFALPSGPPARLVINSLCSCFGFLKRVMPPMAVLLDENGEQVGYPFDFSAERPGMTLPIHYHGEIPAAGIAENARFVLVAADPIVLRGRSNLSADAYAVTPPMVIPIGVGFKAVGKLHVTYSDEL